MSEEIFLSLETRILQDSCINNTNGGETGDTGEGGEIPGN